MYLNSKLFPKEQSWFTSLINSLNVFWKTKNLNTLFFSKTGSGSRRFFFYRSIYLSNQNSLIATCNGPSTICLPQRRKWGIGFSFYWRRKKCPNIVTSVRRLLDTEINYILMRNPISSAEDSFCVKELVQTVSVNFLLGSHLSRVGSWGWCPDGACAQRLCLMFVPCMNRGRTS